MSNPICHICGIKENLTIPSPISVILTELSYYRNSDLPDLELAEHISNSLYMVLHFNGIKIESAKNVEGKKILSFTK